MCGHDTKGRELLMQTPDFVRARGFEVQHQDVGMMPGYGRLNFFVLAYPIHGTKILGKTDRQGLSSSGVIVIDNQAEWFHKSPLEFTAVAVGPAATASSCYHRRSQIRARNSVTFATDRKSTRLNS